MHKFRKKVQKYQSLYSYIPLSSVVISIDFDISGA